MLKNPSATCNSKMHQFKNRADNDYLKLSQSEGKVREISKPVKIGQLLGYSGQLSTKKNSVVKISQPEKLTPYLRNVSNQKRNKINSDNWLDHSENKVRRNLNFAEMTSVAKKTPKIINTSTSDAKQAVSEKKSHPSSRKSLLLPPNTIKDIHIRNRFKNSRSMLPCFNHTRILIADTTNKYPRISEGSETCSPLEENTNTDNNSVRRHKKSNETSVIQHTFSRTFNVNDQSGVNSLHSSCYDLTDRNNDTRRKEIAERSSFDEVSDVYNNQSSIGDDIKTIDKQLSVICNANASVNDIEMHNDNYVDSEVNVTFTLTDMEEPKKESLSVNINERVVNMEKCLLANDSEEDLCAFLQDIRTMSESNVQRDTNEENSERISLSRKKFMLLESNLKHLIYNLEKDVSRLRLMLNTVTNLLSNNTISDDEIKSKRQLNANSNDDAEVTRADVTTTATVNNKDDVSRKTPKTLRFDLLPKILIADESETKENNVETQQSSRPVNCVSDGDNNKENEEDPSTSIKLAETPSELRSETRRRSARLMAKALKNLNTTNDSFVNLENELCITNVRSDTVVKIPLNDCTPVTNKDKKSGRPLREYMALKSRMSCLLTPNAKRFNSSESENSIQTGGTKASLSDKIFAELHNLYADSPDMQ